MGDGDQRQSDDDARLSALAACGLLDSPPEPAFDSLVELAAFISGAPIALVSLVDRDRQWFKSSVGLSEMRETPRTVAFCAHTVAQRAPLEVRDAVRDARFSHNPLVTGEPFIRYYLGIPLFSHDGHPLGTLCIIDRVPRELTIEQHWALVHLAGIANHLIEAAHRARA